MAPSIQSKSLGAGIAAAVLERTGPLVDGEAFAKRSVENKVESEADSQAPTDTEEPAEDQVWALSNEFECFLNVENVKRRSRHWELEEDDAALSEASSISSRWLDDIPESTDVGSPDSISSRASECSCVDSMDEIDFFSPEETIIIFDWDDTICPTTALNGDSPLEDLGSEALQDLVREARLTLERAREVAAEVVIVTNATAGWVESSCENWMPGLRPTLDMLEFASARSTYEPMGITTPTGWKAAAFELIIRRFYSRSSKQSWKNIIVIGDACYEHEALAQVASLAPQGPTKTCRAKSIRFALQPSVEGLARELQMLRESFDEIVVHDGNLELYYHSESL